MNPTRDFQSSLKSPLLALLISIPLPGFGHFFTGSFMRGVVIMIGYYIVLPALTSLHVALAIPCWAVAIGFIARDAWFCTKAAALKESSELSTGVKPRRWLVLVWAAARAAWIIILPGLFGIGMLYGTVWDVWKGHMLAALFSGASAAIPLVIAWLAGRETWRVASGAVTVTEGSLKTEIGTTVIVTGICALLVAITIPRFVDFFRYSAEGATKGSLGELRQAVGRYRSEHDGRSPDSIGAMVEAKTIPEIPVLWRKFDKIPHAHTAEASVVASTAATDSGRWAFIVSPSSPSMTGTIFIDCTHTDTRGRAWSEF